MLTRLGRLVGTGLTVASAGASGALGLFDLKQEVERLSQEATVTLRNRIKGLNRFQRSELLEAAHAVLVVSAFYAALDDLDQQLGTALNTASLELTGAEQARLASGAEPRPGAAGLAELARQLIIPNAVPGLGSGWTERGADVVSFYQSLARRVAAFAAGTAVWDERDQTTRDRWSSAVAEQLPQRALAQYERRLGKIAGEFPEFAFWAQRVGVQTVLDQLYAIRRDTGELAGMLRSLAALTRLMTHGTDPSKGPRALVTEAPRPTARPTAR